MRKGKCPSCQSIIQLDGKVKVRELIDCPKCNTTLEIVRLFPLRLDWAEDPLRSSSRRIFTRRY